MANSVGRAGSGPSISRMRSAGPQRPASGGDNRGKSPGDSDSKPINIGSLIAGTGSQRSDGPKGPDGKDDKKGDDDKGKAKAKGGDDDKKEKGLPPGLAKKEGALPPGIAKRQGENEGDDDDDKKEGAAAQAATGLGQAPKIEPPKVAPLKAEQPKETPQQPVAETPPQLQNVSQALNQAIGGGGSPFGNTVQPQVINPLTGGLADPRQINPITGTIAQGPGTTAAINPNATATISSILNQPPVNADPTTIIGSNVLQNLKAGNTAGFISSLAGNIQSSLNNSAGLFFQLTG